MPKRIFKSFVLHGLRLKFQYAQYWCSKTELANVAIMYPSQSRARSSRSCLRRISPHRFSSVSHVVLVGLPRCAQFVCVALCSSFASVCFLLCRGPAIRFRVWPWSLFLRSEGTSQSSGRRVARAAHVAHRACALCPSAPLLPSVTRSSMTTITDGAAPHAGLPVVMEEEPTTHSDAHAHTPNANATNQSDNNGTHNTQPPTTLPSSLHWSRLLSRLSLFSHVYTHAAREESVQLAALQRAQTLYHRSGRQVKAWHAWMQFVAHDDTSWLERNEWGNSGDSSDAATARVAPLPTYGPLAPWAAFVRLLRSRPRLLALLALPPATGRTVEKVNEVLGYSLLGEKAALAETLAFAFFGQMDAAEEVRAFRTMIRCMIRAEVVNARNSGGSAAAPSGSGGATASAASVVEFWCTLSSSSAAPIDKQTHSRAVAGSISLSAGAYNGPISPPSPTVHGPTSAASASAKFRSRPLRMLLLELTLRRIASQSGGFLVYALGDALRPILQDDKTNLDPQAEVVAAILAKAAAATASPPSASPPPPPSEPVSSSWWRKNKNASAASPATQQVDTSAAATPAPLPVSSPKVKQAVRVTELLLCACVDRLLEALIQAGPRWPSPIKLLLGDALIVSEQLWSRDSAAASGSFSPWGRNASMGPSSASPPVSTMPYTVDANASIFTDDAQMFASSYTAAPPSFLAASSTSPSPPPPMMPTRARQNSRASGPSLAYQPMRREDRPIVLMHILFGLLILPALEKPNLSGVYQDAPLRTRARLNLRVILMLLEQVMVGQPFPPSNPLHVLNKYVATKAATMQAHMMQLADHCMQLAAEREKDDEEIEAEQAAAMHRAGGGGSHSSAGQHGRAIHTVPEGDATEAFAPPPASGLTTPSPVPAQHESTPPVATSQAVSGTVLPPFGETAIMAAAAAAAASSAASAAASSPFPTSIVSPAPASSALLPPVVVHHPSLYLSLSELVTLHHALMRHSEKFSSAGASPQDLQLLTTLRNLPLATAGTISTQGSNANAAARGSGGGGASNGGDSGETCEWKKGQIFEVLMTDSNTHSAGAHAHAASGSGSGGGGSGSTGRTGIGAAISAAAASRKPFPHMVALPKRIEEHIMRNAPKPSFPTSSASVTADAAQTQHLQLVVLLAHTFLAVDASCVQMFAGKRSDLLGMLAHARHELEAGLAGRWEIAAQGLALIAEVDSKLRVANQRWLTARLAESATQPAPAAAPSPASSPSAAGQPALKRVVSAQQLRASQTPSSSNSWLLDPQLSAALFADLERYWTSFESEHAEVHQQDQRTLLYSLHAARAALSSLSLELRLLRDLSFTHKVFIFARQKNNPSQNAHLGRVKFALPASFVAPDRREPSMIVAGGSAGPSPPPLVRPQSVQDLRAAGASGKAPAGKDGSGVAVEPLVIQCTSVDSFLSAFELYGPQLLKAPVAAAKIFHAFLAILERCVREDAGLHISEMGSTAPNNVANNIVRAGGKDKSGGGGGSGNGSADPNDSTPNLSSSLFGVETALLDSAPSKDAVTGLAMSVLEHSICTRLYRFMFPSDRSSSSFEDELLSWKIKGLEWLTPAHVHLPGLAGDDPVWVRPLREFSQLDHAHSPHSKLQVLLTTLKWLAKLLAVKSQFRHMDADSTLSGLIFLLVKSQPLRLHSNLAYIESYLPASRMQGENAYVLTQFSLATGYISDTLSVYDQQALEKEMAEQQAREEERRRGPQQTAAQTSMTHTTASAAAAATSPTNAASPISTPHVTLLSIAVATAGTPVRARSSTLASPSFSGGAFSMAGRPADGSLSLSQSFAVGAQPPSTLASTDDVHLSLLSPSVRDAGPLAAGAADTPLSHGRSGSTALGSMDFASPADHGARSSLSHLQQHLRAVQQQQHQVGGSSSLLAGLSSSSVSRRSLDDDPLVPRARVFRTPALFSRLLSCFSVAEALEVSCVSTQWRLHIVHATRRASVISARS